MSSTPMLAMLNFTKPFTIKADASAGGIGAVLMQWGQPIAYMSHALGVTKQTWSIYTKEMLAISMQFDYVVHTFWGKSSLHKLINEAFITY